MLYTTCVLCAVLLLILATTSVMVCRLQQDLQEARQSWRELNSKVVEMRLDRYKLISDLEDVTEKYDDLVSESKAIHTKIVELANETKDTY